MINSLIRKDDILARIGGEEFLIMLHGTSLDNAMKRGDSMRRKIEQHNWSSKHLTVTVSGGVHECAKGDTIDDILKNVDKHLYHAKSSGKNMIIA